MNSETISAGTILLKNPEMLWLLPALFTVVLMCRWLKCNPERQVYRLIPEQKPLSVVHPLLSLLPKQTQSSHHSISSAIVGWLTFSLLVLALANPVRIGAKLPQESTKQDIVLIVDTSVSMLLKDYESEGLSIDRMSMLKAVLQEFTKDLSAYRLSVIVFGDSPHTLVPFTDDGELVRRMLLRIETGMAGRYNAVGEAIVYAVNETSRHSKRRPVLILFTDMNESVGDIPIDSAARLAAQHKLPLYTVAIGSAGDALPPPKKALSSGLIYGPVNLAALKRVAELTGASAYHARDISRLKQAVNDIAQREKETVTQPVRYYQKPLYPIPLLSILVMLTALQWIPMLKRRNY